MKQQNKSRSLFLRLLNSKMIFPAALFLWFLYFTMVRSEPKGLRGAPTFDAKGIYRDPSKAIIPSRIENLVVVAGHAVIRMSKISVADRADNGWYLLAYQKNQGFPGIIVSHVKKGLHLAKQDPSAMLVFSGGQTRKDVGPTSEAASYYYLADQNSWMTDTDTSSVKSRVYLEEYARDSLENLLFSVCRFKEVQGYYPSKITVVGFDFKKNRYVDLHRKAIGFPLSNFSYVGVTSPPPFDQAKAERGEVGAASSFQKDLYGCSDPALHVKREKRNPFQRTVPYELACPEMKELLHWCGPGLFDVDSLPWRRGRDRS
jgi:hypothetical protein